MSSINSLPGIQIPRGDETITFAQVKAVIPNHITQCRHENRADFQPLTSLGKPGQEDILVMDITCRSSVCPDKTCALRQCISVYGPNS